MRRLLVICGLLATTGAFAACSGSTSSSSAATEAARPGVASAAEPASQANAAGSKPAATVASRSVVVTATVALQATDVVRAADAIGAATVRAGGRIDGDDRSTHSDHPTADLIARVPPAALSGVLHDVDTLGREMSRTIQGDDKTAVRADLDARTAALVTSVTRLRELMARSGSIGDLVALESQLTQRESELESLQAQQRALGDQIALATLTVHVSAPPPVGRPATGPSGFGAAVASGWHGVVVSIRWLLAVIGYLLPFLVPLGVLVVAVVVVLRRRRSSPQPVEG